jgi:hypothetical protein
MNPAVVAALITASGAIAAAGIATLKGMRSNKSARVPPSQAKYFHYISGSKVNMLGAQAGIAVSSSDEDLSLRTIELTRKLEEHGEVADLSPDRRLGSSSYYRSSGLWRHGLFYFTAGGGPKPVGAVSYIAWHVHDESIILLVGSPQNLLEQKEARDGIFFPGTSSAVDAIFQLLDSIHVDEPHYVHNCLGEGKHGKYESGLVKIVRNPQDEGVLATHLAFSEPLIRTKNFLTSPMLPKRLLQNPSLQYPLSPSPSIEVSRALQLATLCVSQFAALEEARMEILFRIFSTYNPVGKNLYDDAVNAGDAYLLALKALDLRKFKSVCVGSPIYTARI